MGEKGIDISGHKGRWINQITLSPSVFSHIVCVDGMTWKHVRNLLSEEDTTVVLLANRDHEGEMQAVRPDA